MSEAIAGSATESYAYRDLRRLLILTGLLVTAQSLAGGTDPRLRTVLYSADEVYRLPARVGYAIELEFQQGEVFLGLGAGDTEGLNFKAEANHLFIKPRAANVHTNVTVLTNRRSYRFDYMTLPPDTTIDQVDTVYALRFLYTDPATITAQPENRSLQKPLESLMQDSTARPERNIDYWYCGAPQLKPISSWDDGVHTHLQFAANAELPAVFVINEDGTESLVNFNIIDDELVIHRVAHRFLLRRGKLKGCVLNRSFSGSGESLPSKTISSRVERRLRGTSNDADP